MQYNEILQNARANMAGLCVACPVCNGVACKTRIPGPGGKGSGTAYVRNFNRLQDVMINMDTLFAGKDVDTSFELFGRTFDLPVFAAPLGATTLHYGAHISQQEYMETLFEGCKEAGILAFGGDGFEEAYTIPVDAMKRVDGHGIATIKPWVNEEMIRKIRIAEEAGLFGLATDVDASGLTLLKKGNLPAEPKSPEDLKAVLASTQLPVIVKGIMTVQGAEKAIEAGAAGIIVSNHGGRVLDHTPATIDVLPEIVAAVNGRCKIFIDGGIRTGLDVFKCLALGADAVLIGRPFATMIYGGGKAAIATYVEKIKTELKETMEMTGANSLAEIRRDMVRF